MTNKSMILKITMDGFLQISLEYFYAHLSYIKHLILVANANEAAVLFYNLKPIPRIGNHRYNDKILMIESTSCQQYYIGMISNTPVIVTMLTDMGGIKINSTTLVLSEAIDIFAPNYAIMVGICASMNEKVKIGDVVIANPIVSYDSKKETEEGVIYRGQRFYPYLLINKIPHIRVLNKFNFKIFKGEVVSGETLADSARFKKEILKAFPETLALDMEGICFATTCQKHNVQWIFIKGISDCGSNKIDNAQRYAVSNAIQVVKLLLDDINDHQENKRNRSIFISGAIAEINQEKVTSCLFTQILTKKLLENGYKIVTALGKTVGEDILKGAYDYVHTKVNEAVTQDNLINHYLLTIPFPYQNITENNHSELISGYCSKQRFSLLNASSIVIFIYGNKTQGTEGTMVLSSGMKEELKIAEDFDCLIVPIGATGYMAQEIWKEYSLDLYGHYSKYLPNNENDTKDKLKEKFDFLNNPEGKIVYEDKSECELLVERILDFIINFIVRLNICLHISSHI